MEAYDVSTEENDVCMVEYGGRMEEYAVSLIGSGVISYFLVVIIVLEKGKVLDYTEKSALNEQFLSYEIHLESERHYT